MAAKTHPDTLRGLELIAQGMTVRAAAEAVGVAPSTLTRALAKAGAPKRNPGRRPS